MGRLLDLEYKNGKKRIGVAYFEVVKKITLEK